MCLRKLFGKRRERKYMEFLILNWEGANEADPSAVLNLEGALPPAGAITVGTPRSPRGVLYQVEVTDPTVERQELLEIFERFGFQVDQTA